MSQSSEALRKPTMLTGTHEPTAWNQVNWMRCEKFVHRLQVGIAKAVDECSRASALFLAKEPYEVKVSRTVLKTSRYGKPYSA